MEVGVVDTLLFTWYTWASYVSISPTNACGMIFAHCCS